MILCTYSPIQIASKILSATWLMLETGKLEISFDSSVILNFMKSVNIAN